jgi:hypothetical protein
MALDNSIFADILRMAAKQGHLLGFHTSEDLDSFELGRVLQINDPFYTLLTVSEEGQQGPLQIALIEDIRRLSVGGPYVEAFEHLAPGLQQPRLLNDVKDFSFQSVLRWSASHTRVLTISERCGTSTHGPIVSWDDTSCRQAVYSKSGEYKGDEVMWLKDVRRIDFDGVLQRRIEDIIFGKQNVFEN